MTILRDFYGPRRKLPTQAARSGEQGIKQTHPTSEEARANMAALPRETFWLSSWTEVVFVHYEVDPELLQPEVPFPLETFEGHAYVSLVAFNSRKMRPKWGGRWTRWMTAPVAEHPFMNLRTYVRHGQRTGIYFMKQWLNNWLSLVTGKVVFGLPFEAAAIDYETPGQELRRSVSAKRVKAIFTGELDAEAAPAQPGSLEAFLVERYEGYAAAGKWPLLYRVWHRPWQITPIRGFRFEKDSLLEGLKQKWTDTATLIGAHYSPGFDEVWMGRPHLAG